MADRLLFNNEYYTLFDVKCLHDRPVIVLYSERGSPIYVRIDLYCKELDYKFHPLEFLLNIVYNSEYEEGVVDEYVAKTLRMYHEKNICPIVKADDTMYLIRGDYYARITDVKPDENIVEKILNGDYDALFTNRL